MLLMLTNLLYTKENPFLSQIYCCHLWSICPIEQFWNCIIKYYLLYSGFLYWKCWFCKIYSEWLCELSFKMDDAFAICIYIEMTLIKLMTMTKWSHKLWWEITSINGQTFDFTIILYNCKTEMLNILIFKIIIEILIQYELCMNQYKSLKIV